MAAPTEDAGLLADTSVWLVFSFVIFVYILYKFGKNAITSMLDQRFESIRQDIESAVYLRIEALELLAQYERNHRDAVKESESIIANAEKHATQIKKDAEADLAESMERREKQLQERLDRMKHGAIAEIQSYAATLAIEATKEIITSELDKKANEKLVDESIQNIGKNLH